ncbi:MAG TPA: potassium channel family protein [Rhizomicrobium sp.]|jgi:hypothetical protein
MIVAILLGIFLLVATVFFHFEGLRFLWHYAASVRGHTRYKPITIIFGIIVLHLVEMGFYGWAFWFGDVPLNIGDFVGHEVGLRDYIYFSAETYTTLGFGDIYPVGDLRLIASVEALNGLLMLGWSASFIYLAMEKYWERGRGKN